MVRKKDTLESVQKEFDEAMHKIINKKYKNDFELSKLETIIAICNGKLKRLKQ